jgi:hypothetical protein
MKIKRIKEEVAQEWKTSEKRIKHKPQKKWKAIPAD